MSWQTSAECADVTHAQLDELMSNLATARDTEAAARMDVDDRKADEAEAINRRRMAELRLFSMIEHTRQARVAVTDYIEWQTSPAIEEADAQMRLKLIDGRKEGRRP